MSVQTELDRIIGAVEAAHLKVAEKGGTTARPYLVGNLEGAIDTIPPSEDLDAEIATQKQLISDIQTALEGKAAGGSGGGSSEPETVSVNMLRGSNLSTLRVVYAFTQYKDGAFAFNHSNYFAGSTTTPTVLNNVLKGSFIVVYSNNKSYKVSGVTVTDGLTLVVMIDGTAIIGVNADCPAEGATITANSASA